MPKEKAYEHDKLKTSRKAKKNLYSSGSFDIPQDLLDPRNATKLRKGTECLKIAKLRTKTAEAHRKRVSEKRKISETIGTSFFKKNLTK